MPSTPPHSIGGLWVLLVVKVLKLLPAPGRDAYGSAAPWHRSRVIPDNDVDLIKPYADRALDAVDAATPGAVLRIERPD